MEAPSIDGGYYYRSSFGDPGDGVWWYSLEGPDGSALTIFLWGELSSICSVCQNTPIPVGQGCSLIPDGGVSRGWGGYAITGIGSCTVPATPTAPATQLGCATTECLPPGRYVVKMCAEKNACRGDAGTCVEVPFDFPTDTEVVGRLPP